MRNQGFESEFRSDDLRAWLVPIELYAQVRKRYTSYMVDLRQRRRITIGDSLTVLFENRETILAHLHELMWFQGGWNRDSIELWMNDCSALMVPKGTLAATVLVDGGGHSFARTVTDGVNERSALFLSIGDERFPALARDRSRHNDVVHYVRFDLTRTAAIHLQPGSCDASVLSNLEPEQAMVPISAELKSQLASDLGHETFETSHLSKLVRNRTQPRSYGLRLMRN